jgi:hypothetical protein
MVFVAIVADVARRISGFPAARGRIMSEATIRDVARHAEVSVATVSRALNGLDNVREQTKQRIMEAAKTLGYVPHAGARSLSLARTNAIGVVLPDLHGEFFSEIVRGMDREASRSGYLLLLSNMHGRREQATLAMRAMHGRVDALVVMAPHLNEDEVAAALPVGLRAMLINTRDASHRHPAIHLDNQASARCPGCWPRSRPVSAAATSFTRPSWSFAQPRVKHWRDDRARPQGADRKRVAAACRRYTARLCNRSTSPVFDAFACFL